MVTVRRSGWQRKIRGLLLGAAGIAVVTAVVWPLKQVVPVLALAGLYVLPILPVAVGWGLWPALIVAVAAALAFDFFVFPPELTITTLADPSFGTILVTSAVTAFVVSELAGRTRRRAREAESLAREVRRIADEQSGLQRVATLVAGGAAPAEVFGSVATEVGGLFGADIAVVFRFEPERTATVVGRWSAQGAAFPKGARLRVEGVGVMVAVLETGRPARTGRFSGPPGSTAGYFARLGLASGVGVPINVEGRLWGAVVAATTEPERLPAGSETSIAGFTELVATAIANAQARVELRGYAEEQAALRRVATLVARSASPEEVFATVTQEAGRVLYVDYTSMIRFDPDGAMTWVGSWSNTGTPFPIAVGTRAEPGGRNMPTLVFETGRPARVDYADASGAVATIAHEVGVRSSVGVPINVEGRLWGLLAAVSTQDEPLPADTEARLAGFTELVATAVANTQARIELRGFADQQAALRRVATLVARAAPPRDVFAAVTAEVGRVLAADVTILNRYDPDGTQTVIGAWSSAGPVPVPLGTRTRLGGRNVSTLVFETGRPARVDDYTDTGGPVGVASREVGVQASIGVPVSVGGRLWGVMIAATCSVPLPADTESRLAGFTELVATALANTEAEAALAASRARVVVAADQARRRIERDLHDGAQQRLVSLALGLQAAQATVASDAGGLEAQLDSLAVEAASALEELRELARGIHPAVLAEGGVRPALTALARRCAVPVDLEMRVDERLPEQIEIAAYYVVSEALANAAKHARASIVHVEVDAGERDGSAVLRVQVRDNGCGGAHLSGGTGLVGLKDRVEALGGTVAIRSPPGEGTALCVTLPISAPDRA